MQRGKKTDVENHGKASDARRKIENRGSTACMGVKTCVGGNKMWKMTAKTKSALKNWIQPTVSVGRNYNLCPMLDAGPDSVQHRQMANNINHAVENHAF